MNASCPNCHFDDCLESDRYCIKCGQRLARAGAIEEDCAATKRVYDSTMVHVRLGLVYMQNGKRDRAVASWKAALDVDPENKEALALLEKYGSEDAAENVKTSKAKAA
jgi:tetratricopeptide (TPR) repeat protein